MISGRDFYNVMSAMVPLYVAMIVAYASVRWVKIFTPEQISGISRFVSTFAVPLLSFHFVSANNPYEMNFLFIGADTLQKIIIFVLLLAFWGIFFRKRASIFGSTPLEWVITIFSLATLPNTLVMGIPLLVAMYGEDSGSRSLMVQVVVLQCIVWYTLLLFLFEFRGARVLIAENFPDTAAAIASIEVDSDVVSLDGYMEPLETESEVGSDGRIRVVIRRSGTRRSSALTGAEIFSVHSPESNYNSTPRGSTVNYADQYGRFSVGIQSGFGSEFSSRPSNYIEDGFAGQRSKSVAGSYGYPGPNPELVMGGRRSKRSTGEKDVHMFNWNTIESPASEVGRLPVDERFRNATVGTKDILKRKIKEGHQEREDMALAGRDVDEDGEGEEVAAVNQMPPTSVMTKLILIMVWRKLIRNPNTWTSILGLIWSLIAFRWNITMPKIIADSISILSNTGLGMAMFSLGLFMAMQPKLIACGYKLALFSMAIRFIIGPAIAAVAAVACGLRGRLLRISIVQAALPQGIVPFVFAKEYNNHPAVLSTAVIFGMLVALPVDLLYFILLGL